MDKMWYLKQIDIFSDLNEPQLQKVNEIAIHKPLKKKEIIYLPGDRSDKVYLLKEGRVKVSRISEDGKEMTTVILEPGEIFGESALFGDEEYRSTMAEALNDAMVCTVYRNEFEDILKRQPEISLKLTKEIGKRKQEIENRLEDMVFRNVTARLAHLLLNLAKKYGKEKEEGVLIDFPLTHLEIARLIGSTRETTTTEINNLKRDGRLSVKKRAIYLTDIPELEELAQVYE